jgi:hypothetical protein
MNTQEILQDWLDIVTNAVMQGDYTAYRAHICLPFHLITHSASLRIDDDAPLRQGFDSFLQMLRSQRVTDYIRLASGAEQLDDVLITGRYVSHLLVNGTRLLPPFKSAITLRREDGVWRAASITNALANSRWPIHLLHVDDSKTSEGTDK